MITTKVYRYCANEVRFRAGDDLALYTIWADRTISAAMETTLRNDIHEAEDLREVQEWVREYGFLLVEVRQTIPITA
jgi:hypothetical protein